jgi:hypothetical protein
LIALASGRHLPLPKATAFVGMVAGISWLSFEIARRWFHESPGWLGLAGYPAPLSFWIFSPVLSLVLTSLGLFASIRRVGINVSGWIVPIAFAAVMLVWPLSVVSIKLVPAHGYVDGIHAVKAGYPMFWVNALVAGAVAVSMRLG